MSAMLESLLDIMRRGGVVMWPILGLSLVAVTLSFERCWFWLTTNHSSRLARVSRMAAMLRRGERDAVRVLAQDDHSVYGRVVRLLLEEGPSDAVITEAVESQRGRLERFMPTLSTIITAAPMLGILGTVTGIISSFQVLSDDMAATNPRLVSQGIAEALLTTAAGLLVAIVVLLPYNAFRAQLDRTLGRIETLCAAAARSPAAAAPTQSSPEKAPAA